MRLAIGSGGSPMHYTPMNCASSASLFAVMRHPLVLFVGATPPPWLQGHGVPIEGSAKAEETSIRMRSEPVRHRWELHRQGLERLGALPWPLRIDSHQGSSPSEFFFFCHSFGSRFYSLCPFEQWIADFFYSSPMDQLKAAILTLRDLFSSFRRQNSEREAEKKEAIIHAHSVEN
jgi:hypothetical protein